MSFDKIEYAFLFLLIPLFILVLKYQSFWRSKKQAEFSDKSFSENIFPKVNVNLKIILYTLFIICITISLIDILAGKQEIKVKNQGFDLVFAVDISNSMNCDDVQPTRLEKAKKIITDILKKTSGNRVGIVVFAGEALPVLPLTYDYNAVDQFVKNISTTMMDYQGTDLGIAMKEACGLFNSNQKSAKIVVLLSDGEDHEGNENSGIDYAKEAGVKVISIGIGTEKGGTISYISDDQQIGFLTDESGNPVISKLQENALKKIASKTDGGYFSSTNSSEIAEYLNNSFQKISTNGTSEIDSFASKHYFQYFLFIAFILIIAISILNFKNEFGI